MELLWRDSLTCPTEDEYIAMVNDSKCVCRWTSRGLIFFMHADASSLFLIARNRRSFKTRSEAHAGCQRK